MEISIELLPLNIDGKEFSKEIKASDVSDNLMFLKSIRLKF
ncbi:hypothetical protein CHAB381_1754 [Campylobacter hominis ATCC BAA-381]|uniref:Uncharacterized protein n=1 Tax=Campylobacter hominis (strain ATCC BAA-381 / DSM 21671 / CCUG 45161 / LMG 19568 / NCTC 13146 / CH001A) TaxID=360107 RepID=A7I424_CAMHC|nr:hypothetical protein CHAB381_1754 [Campylobacter hominis ATCC BAA-381]